MTLALVMLLVALFIGLIVAVLVGQRRPRRDHSRSRRHAHLPQQVAALRLGTEPGAEVSWLCPLSRRSTPMRSAMQRVSAAPQPRLHKSFPSSSPVSMAEIGALRGDTETPVEVREALKPARGLILGLLVSLSVWSAIGLLNWFLLRR